MRQFFGRRRNRRGSTMVEFALVALPLIIMVFASIELLIMSATSMMLSNATEEAARVLYTGQFQKGSQNTARDFKAFLCSRAVLLQDCGYSLLIDLREFGDWDEVSLPKLIDKNGAYTVDPAPDSTAVTICGERIVVLRVLYRWTLYTPGISIFLRGDYVPLSPDNWLEDNYLFQTRVFVVEPWDFTRSTC